MATIVTFHLVSTPDDAKGQVALDVVNTFTMSDVDSQRMLEAYIAKYTPPPRGGVGRRGGEVDVTPPTPEDAITRASTELWNQLSGYVQSYFVRKSQAAVVPVAPIAAPQETKVNVAAVSRS